MGRQDSSTTAIARPLALTHDHGDITALCSCRHELQDGQSCMRCCAVLIKRCWAQTMQMGVCFVRYLPDPAVAVDTCLHALPAFAVVVPCRLVPAGV